jgi:hypothetical protein
LSPFYSIDIFGYINDISYGRLLATAYSSGSGNNLHVLSHNSRVNATLSNVDKIRAIAVGLALTNPLK